MPREQGNVISEEERHAAEMQKAAYACGVCKNMFNDPGMCPQCKTVLKKGAA